MRSLFDIRSIWMGTRSVFGKSRSPVRARNHRILRPRTEQLESRQLLATRIWDGGALSSDKWTNRFNWEQNTAPVAGDTLIFPDLPDGSDRRLDNDFPQGTQFAQLRFDGSGYNISGSRIALGPGGIVVSRPGFIAIDIDNALNLISGSTTINVSTGGSLDLRGPIVGAGGLVKRGAGRLTFGGTQANTYTGTTSVLDGELHLLKQSSTQQTVSAMRGPLVIGDPLFQFRSGGDGLVYLTSQPRNNTPAGLMASGMLDGVPITVEKKGRLEIQGAGNGLSTHSPSQLTLNGGTVEFLAGVRLSLGPVTVNASSEIDGSPEDSLRFTSTVTVNNSGTSDSILGVFAGTIDSPVVKLGNGRMILQSAFPDVEHVHVRGGSVEVNTFFASAVDFFSVGLNEGSQDARLIIFGDADPVTPSIEVLATGILEARGLRKSVGTLKLNGGAVLMTDEPNSVPELRILGSLQVPSSSSISGGELIPLGGISVAAGQTLTVMSRFDRNTLVVSGGGIVDLRNPSQTTSSTIIVTNSSLSLPVGMNRADLSIQGTLNAFGSVMSITTNPGSNGVLSSVNPGGATPATLTAQRLSLANSILNLQLNGTATNEFDQLRFTGLTDGNLSLFARLNVTLGFTPAVNTVFKILDNTGSGSLTFSGLFRGPTGVDLQDNATFDSNGATYRIHYESGPGGDVTLTYLNSAPAFQNRRLTPVLFAGQVATLSGRITEPNRRDTFFLDVNWGDGTRRTYKIQPGTPRQIQVRHRYIGDPQGRDVFYNVTFLWRDQHGSSNQAELPIRVRSRPRNFPATSRTVPVAIS